MIITVVKVTEKTVPGKNGKRPYKRLEVLYQTEAGEARTKTLVSYSNPSVFKFFSEAELEVWVDVTSNKNEESGYWDWTAVEYVPVGEPTADDKPTTKPERDTTVEAPKKVLITEADRQRLIVRQSAVKAAVDFLKDYVNDGKKSTVIDVIQLAEVFESHVFRPEGVSIIQQKPPAPEAPQPKATGTKRKVVKAEPRVADTVGEDENDDQEEVE